MSDSISRADAIRWVKTECNPYGKPTLDYDSGLKVIEHLKQMPSAEAKWIPCSERLPDEDDAVLATIRYLDEAEDDQTDPYYTIEVIFLHDGKWMGNGSWVESFGYTKVTAWKPLPEPYREDGEA